MKASETTVREKQYVVPLYQRRYSWERKDDKDPLNQLWDDILSLDSSDPTSTHFLGSVVLAPSPSNTPAGVVRWLVVDGQQRLTRRATSGTGCCLPRRTASRGSRWSSDTPTRAARTGSARPTVSFCANCRRWMTRRMNTTSVESSRPITTRLALVAISAHADDNVHRIFESLNYKGQPLTQADLLRNYLFMRLPHRGDEVYTHQWLPLQKLLSDTELEELAWLDLVLRGDDRATQESIYRSQQLRLGPLKDERASWPDPERTDDPRKVLEAEGVRFDELGRADPEQRMTAADLAEVMELGTNA